MKRTPTVIVAILLACYLPVCKASAQVSIQYDNENQFFNMSSIAPPPFINDSMPPEVMAAYIVADSLCKSFDEMRIDSIADELADDSIDAAFKAIISAQHFDPLLYQHAIFHTSFMRVEGYVAPYKSLVQAVNRNYHERVRPPNRYDSIRTSSRGGIYYVKVRYQNHRIDTTNLFSPHFSHIDRYYAELELLTPIFGAALPFTCIEDKIEGTYPCVKTAWMRFPFEHELAVHNDGDYYKVGPGVLVPGNEYIVFLQTWAAQIKKNGSIDFEIYPEKTLAVSGGVVYDPDNYCGLGTEVGLEKFIHSLRVNILCLE